MKRRKSGVLEDFIGVWKQNSQVQEIMSVGKQVGQHLVTHRGHQFFRKIVRHFVFKCWCEEPVNSEKLKNERIFQMFGVKWRLAQIVSLVQSTSRGRLVSSIRYRKKMGGQMDGLMVVSFRRPQRNDDVLDRFFFSVGQGSFLNRRSWVRGFV